MRTEAGYPEGGGAPILYPSVNTLTRAALLTTPGHRMSIGVTTTCAIQRMN